MFTQTSGKTPHRVFSVAFPGHKMRVHLLTAPDDILVIWVSPIQLGVLFDSSSATAAQADTVEHESERT
jgi:hypothetical protein